MTPTERFIRAERAMFTRQADRQLTRRTLLDPGAILRDPAPTIIGYSGRSERAMAEWHELNG